MSSVINPISGYAVAGWQTYTSDSYEPNYAYAVFDSNGNVQNSCTFLDSSSAQKDPTTDIEAN